MSKVSDLKNALTELFRKGTEVGYTETEIDEFLEDIDYHTLLQAVWDSAETVYAFRADGRHELSLNYRGAELFQQRATLLYEDMGEGFAGVVTAVRSMELWLLEDMGFAIVANFSLEAGNCEYVTEYRVYKGSDWTDSELDLDFEELVADLAKMCQPYYCLPRWAKRQSTATTPARAVGARFLIPSTIRNWVKICHTCS